MGPRHPPRARGDVRARPRRRRLADDPHALVVLSARRAVRGGRRVSAAANGRGGGGDRHAPVPGRRDGGHVRARSCAGRRDGRRGRCVDLRHRTVRRVQRAALPAGPATGDAGGDERAAPRSHRWLHAAGLVGPGRPRVRGRHADQASVCRLSAARRRLGDLPRASSTRGRQRRARRARRGRRGPGVVRAAGRRHAATDRAARGDSRRRGRKTTHALGHSARVLSHVAVHAAGCPRDGLAAGRHRRRADAARRLRRRRVRGAVRPVRAAAQQRPALYAAAPAPRGGARWHGGRGPRPAPAPRRARRARARRRRADLGRRRGRCRGSACRGCSRAGPSAPIGASGTSCE